MVYLFFFSWTGVNGTGSIFWFILNDGVALNSVFPMSCMSLVGSAMTQLWQDHVKNMAWWVSKESWDSRDCVLIIRNTNFKAPLWGGGTIFYFHHETTRQFISPRGTFGQIDQYWNYLQHGLGDVLHHPLLGLGDAL